MVFDNFYLKNALDLFEGICCIYNYHICAKVQVWHGLTAASDAKFESVKVHEGLILRTTAYC